MIEADSVLSTPPLSSSSIQEANPRSEARAESVDSFSHQPGIGQPETKSLTSESPNPFEDVDLALLRFVRSLVQFGLTPGEAAAVVSAELERAEALVSKRRPRRYWISGPYLVSGPAELRARA